MDDAVGFKSSQEYTAAVRGHQKIYALPKNLWGASVLCIIIPRHIFSTDGFALLVPQYIGLSLVVTCQIIMVCLFAETVSDGDIDVCFNRADALLVSLLLPVATVLNNEVNQAYEMWAFERLLPEYLPEHDEVLDTCGLGLAFEPHGDYFAIATTGITPLQRWWIRMLVIVRLSICCFVVHWTAAYIVFTDAIENAILNSLSTVFILELDDLLYELVNSRRTRLILESFPGLVPRDTPLKARTASTYGRATRIELNQIGDTLFTVSNNDGSEFEQIQTYYSSLWQVLFVIAVVLAYYRQYCGEDFPWAAELAIFLSMLGAAVCCAGVGAISCFICGIFGSAFQEAEIEAEEDMDEIEKNGSGGTTLKIGSVKESE